MNIPTSNCGAEAPAVQAAADRGATLCPHCRSALRDTIASLLYVAILGGPLLLITWYGSVRNDRRAEFEERYAGMIESGTVWRLQHHALGHTRSIKKACDEYDSVAAGKMQLEDAAALKRYCDAELFKKYCAVAKTGWETK